MSKYVCIECANDNCIRDIEWDDFESAASASNLKCEYCEDYFCSEDCLKYHGCEVKKS